MKKLSDTSYNFTHFSGMNKLLFLSESKNKIKTDKINLVYSFI